MSAEIKKDILWRVYLMYFLMCIFGITIIGRVIDIQFIQGDKWKSKAASLTIAYKPIDAVRGSIYAEDGSLLATSLPYYDVGMDVNTEYLTNERFNENIDSLCYCLSNMFGDRSKSDYLKLLVKARKAGDRYVLLQRSVSYDELQDMKKFPLFRKGRYKGGLVAFQINKRERPFKMLAARTIGYERPGIKPVGLEGAYNQYLKGVSGQRLMQKIAGGVWMPVNDNNAIDPKEGCDLISTIDVNIQDVAEHALLKQLEKHHADHGCVVLMEVKTGKVRAIANLTRKDTADYEESYNYAVGEATEPGSTFKLASLITAMEDGYVHLNDSVDLENGAHRYFDRVMHDADHNEGHNVTVLRAFEISSNVGISKTIYKYYQKDPQKFVDGLCRLGLNKPLGLSIPGEGVPRIKNTTDKDWSGTSLPWMAIGYEVLVTPLQTLTLYNAVANNGVMVKPLFVDQIRQGGKVIKSFKPVVINPSICSAATIRKAKKLLEGVVQEGTARNLRNKNYQIAGKTGTAQIAKKGSYRRDSKVSYQASFVGYFPANNPKYSCIVVVNSPSKDGYYGDQVAGPIFKEIADKVYATSLEIHKPVNANPPTYAVDAPDVAGGDKGDINEVLKKLDIHYDDNSGQDQWAYVRDKDSNTVQLQGQIPEQHLRDGLMPNVKGMSAEDAVYLLENAGLHVKISGVGTVKKQSIKAGSKFDKGTQVILELS